MNRSEIIDLHNLVTKEDEKTYIDAGKYVLDMAGQKNVDVRPDQGKAILTALFHSFLDTDQYIEAALLAWGNIKFNPEPEEVKRIWDLMLNEPFGIILGSGSVGKTYNGVIFTLLNWCRDPEYTNSKMISTVEGHTKANSWSTLVEFHKDAIISMPGMEPTSNTLVLRPRQLQSAIAIVAIPQSDDGKGRLQGFHPLPRRKPDPILGRLSRVNVFIDEAEKVPGGLWVGIDNLQTARTEEGSVRVTAVTNPEDVTSPLAQRAEPPNGWDSIDIDEDFKWTSRMGWKVIRLDAAQSENVKQKKVVYPGLQTYDGYQGLTRLGINHPRYYCADTETEALSKKGWVKYVDLSVGDEIYTVNPKTGLAEWAPVEEVFVRHYEGKMISVEGRGLSALVTPNHRWPTTYKNKSNKELILKRTDKLKKYDLIPIGAQSSSFGSDSDADFAALIGWIITDGTFGLWNEVSIGQSKVANPVKCNIIHRLLISLDAKFNINEQGRMLNFRFGRELGKRVKKAIPSKRLTMDFIETLDCGAMTALMDSMILGDGGIQGYDTRYFCSSHKADADLFSAIAARLGYSTGTYFRYIRPNTFPNGIESRGSWMYYVNLRKSKHSQVKYLKFEPVDYSGEVWCPRTENGTFLARRSGDVYFTGNTFGRGFYPRGNIEFNIVSPGYLSNSKAIYNFITIPNNVASLDPAFADGGDEAILTTGRYGLSDGLLGGKRFNPPKMAVQYEQQFPIKKDNTLLMADNIMMMLRNLRIKPEHFIMDKTGNALGLHDVIRLKFGNIYGVSWGTEASSNKILLEDTEIPKDLFKLVVTEMWFAFARWLEYEHVMFSPIMDTHQLFGELTARKYSPRGRRRKVESKAEYKSHSGGRSPDRADSTIMLVHLCRLIDHERPTMIPQVRPTSDADWTLPSSSKLDDNAIPFIEFKD